MALKWNLEPKSDIEQDYHFLFLQGKLPTVCDVWGIYLTPNRLVTYNEYVYYRIKGRIAPIEDK